MPAEGRDLASGCFQRGQGHGDWREPDDSCIGPAAPAEAVHQSEGGAPVPLLSAVRQGVSAPAPVLYYVFDVMVLAGRSLMREPLERRRELLEQKVLPKLSEPARYASSLDAALSVLVQSVKQQGFEGSSPSDALAYTSRDCAPARG
jgi:hypothetical protein